MHSGHGVLLGGVRRDEGLLHLLRIEEQQDQLRVRAPLAVLGEAPAAVEVVAKVPERGFVAQNGIFPRSGWTEAPVEVT